MKDKNLEAIDKEIERILDMSSTEAVKYLEKLMGKKDKKLRDFVIIERLRKIIGTIFTEKDIEERKKKSIK